METFWLVVAMLSLSTTLTASRDDHKIINFVKPNINNRNSKSFELAQERRFKRRVKTSGLLPEFSAPIGNVTAVLGRDVRLICTVEQLGQYQVAWLKEETKTILSIDTNIIITNYRIFLIPDEEERKWVLHIKDVQESDRGFYQCQVNTSPMRSTSGYLEVIVPPTIIESQTSQVIEVTEHSNVSIHCKANGHPRASISWRRDDGTPIRLSGRFSFDSKIDQYPSNTSSSLESTDTIGGSSPTIISQLNDFKSDKLSLIDVDRSMGGIYVCMASNGIPTHASKRIPLYVKFPPKTSVQNKYISVSLSDQLEVDCLIEAFPKADSHWSKKSISQVHRGEVARWSQLVAGDGNRRALSFKSKQSIDDLQNSNRLINLSSVSMIDEINAGLVDVQLHQPIGKQNHQLELPTTQYSSHPHNRIQFRQVDHHLVSDELAASLSNYWPTPTIVGSIPAPSPRPWLTELSSSSLNTTNEAKAYVTVKQTAISSYTYKLRLTIARMQHDDYGEYSCISTNSLGTSKSHVIVTKADKISDRNRSPQPSSDYRSIEVDEYQRDSLDSKHYPQPQQAGSRRTSSMGNRVIYDENYLQAIKTRQTNIAGSSKLQQKLKSRQFSERNPASSQQKASLSMMIIVLIAILAG